MKTTIKPKRARKAHREISEQQRWERYEEEKWKLQQKNLTPKEYERAISEILNRLGL